MKKYQDYTKEQLIKVIEEKNITISRLNGEVYYYKNIKEKYIKVKEENGSLKVKLNTVNEHLKQARENVRSFAELEFVLLTEENTIEQLLFTKGKFVEYVNKQLCTNGEKVKDPEEAIEFASEMYGFTIDVLTLECEV